MYVYVSVCIFMQTHTLSQEAVGRGVHGRSEAARKQHRRFSLDVCPCVFVITQTHPCVFIITHICVYFHANTLFISGSGGAWCERLLIGASLDV